ncbi:MAG: tRNA (adenosine(37)-N6)-threonylcarbamoyltransferase complex ATPase subunit type 1 TsaE [Candidatus Paceibacterota bacterium]
MTTVSEGELQGFVERFLQEISENTATDRTKSVVVALSGDLGAGKTTFTRTLARVLGVTGPVTSPTFVIEQVYDLPADKNFGHLVHIDAYRLESSEDLRRLGWDDIVADPANCIVVEWAQKVADILPEDAVWLMFEVVGEKEREITTGPQIKH